LSTKYEDKTNPQNIEDLLKDHWSFGCPRQRREKRQEGENLSSLPFLSGSLSLLSSLFLPAASLFLFGHFIFLNY